MRLAVELPPLQLPSLWAPATDEPDKMDAMNSNYLNKM
jgi:hypothetical protein